MILSAGSWSQAEQKEKKSARRARAVVDGLCMHVDVDEMKAFSSTLQGESVPAAAAALFRWLETA